MIEEDLDLLDAGKKMTETIFNMIQLKIVIVSVKNAYSS